MANEYRINALNAEVVAAFGAAARVNALNAEVVASFPADAILHALCVEVVRSIDDVPLSTGRRRQNMLGSF